LIVLSNEQHHHECRDHKGSGLALIFELLSGALVGGSMENKAASKNWGCLVAAVDPALFGDAEDFTQRVEQMAGRVKGARREEGVAEIMLPGERGYREAGECFRQHFPPLNISPRFWQKREVCGS
jgi:LDH2 family malate/lactate/ureidoglycolate dehydrogenase